MSNDDYSRLQGPTGPHAPHVPVGAPGSRQPWMDEGKSIAGPIMGGGADVAPRGVPGGLGANLSVAVMAMFVFFAADKIAVPILICLYPLGGGAAIAAAAVAYKLVNTFAPTLEYGSRMVIVALAACIVWWPASRREQRFGEITSYRRVRHVARLALLGSFAYWLTAPRAFGPLPASLRPVGHVFTSQEQIAIVAGTVLVAHVVLTRGSMLRGLWYMALEALKLRASS